MLLVGPRDKKNKENTGPFPIQEGTYDKNKHANELVIFESVQAVPLFIVYTNPDIVKSSDTVDANSSIKKDVSQFNFFENEQISVSSG